MKEILQFLNSIGVILGIVGLLAAGVFGGLLGRNKAELDRKDRTIKSYADANSGLEEIVKTRDLQHEGNQKRIILLEQKSEVLENQVTQAPSINNLAIQLATQHKQTMGLFNKLIKEIGNIAKTSAKKEETYANRPSRSQRTS